MTENKPLSLQAKEEAEKRFPAQPGKHWIRTLRNARVEAFILGAEFKDSHTEALRKEIEELQSELHNTQGMLNHANSELAALRKEKEDAVLSFIKWSYQTKEDDEYAKRILTSYNKSLTSGNPDREKV